MPGWMNHNLESRFPGEISTTSDRQMRPPLWQKAQKTHGKTSVKKLVGEGVGVSSIEVTDGNIKSFERVARKYNVDFG